MIKKLAIIFGIVFLVVGILGFIPGAAPLGDNGERHLLGIFEVNTVHNIVHLLSGIVALITGLASARAARLYFKIFGTIYAIVTVLGIILSGSILGLFHVNGADNLLHLVLAVVILGIGFFVPSSDEERSLHAAA